MFKSKTVVVVGAGASAECGMPTGDALKNSIAKGLSFRFKYGRLESGDDEILDILKTIGRGDSSHINRLVRAGQQLSSTIDTFPSIDEALHWWRDNEEIVMIGKIAIAKTILSAERRSTLFPDREKGQVLIANAAGSWLQTFLSICLSGCDRTEVLKAFENVTFVSFNYDRIIEQYIYWALQQRGGVAAEVAAQAVSSLNILRPYGSLGRLDWRANHEVDFGGAGSSDTSAIASNIRTFTEQVDGLNIAPLIDAALRDAELVLFLGFGFHQQNLQLFKVQNGSNRNQIRRVLGTAYGLDLQNYTPLTRKLQLDYGFQNIALLDAKAEELLTKMRPTISMTVS